MSGYIRIISAVIICCIIIAFLRESKKEYSFIAALLSGTVVLIYAFKNISVIIGQISGFMSENNIDVSGISILLKAVGISVVCQFACEICADTNNRALQFSVELIGKTAILLTSMPLISSVMTIVSDYIK